MQLLFLLAKLRNNFIFFLCSKPVQKSDCLLNLISLTHQSSSVYQDFPASIPGRFPNSERHAISRVPSLDVPPHHGSELLDKEHHVIFHSQWRGYVWIVGITFPHLHHFNRIRRAIHEVKVKILEFPVELWSKVPVLR